MTASVPVAKPEVFTRKASGLVRVMSPYSAFVYNILTMGLIFPWTYLWAPGALPGGKMVWGIILAMLIEIPIALVYVWLSTALPRSGGDYVFQSRVFGGGMAFTVVMSGFVIWILQWVALSGWLLSYLGFAPLFLGLGATLGNAALSSIGVWFTQSTGIIITSILNALVALLILATGFKNYVRFQWVMFYTVLLAFLVMFGVLFFTPASIFIERLNAFAVASGGSANFYATALAAVKAAGIDTHPPFSLLATILVAPIAWTSLQWATYSAEQNGEIKDARSFKNQAFIMVGSLIVTGLLLALLAVGLERLAGSEFLYVAGAGYWSLIPEATVNGFYLWPNIIAIAVAAQPGGRFDHRSGLHPELAPDCSQLLHRYDPHHGCHVVRPPAARVVQQGRRTLPHPGQCPPGLLPGQHPGHLRLQPGAWMGRINPGRHLRLWLCVHHHLPGRSAAPIQGKRGLRSLPRSQVHRQRDASACSSRCWA